MGQSVTPTAPRAVSNDVYGLSLRCLLRMGLRTSAVTPCDKTTRRHFLDILLLGPARRRCYNVAVPGAAPADGTRGQGVGAEERT